MVSISFTMVVQFLLGRRSFIILQRFSIGFKSGEFPRQSNTEILFKLTKFLTFRLVWHGAKSY